MKDVKTSMGVLLSFCLIFTLPPTNNSPSTVSKTIRWEASWLASLQRDDGAILTFPKQGIEEKISPYFANLAAEGMAQDPHQLERVKQYIQWYFNHINRPDSFGAVGTIDDYQIDAKGNELSTHNYDSADSYAATFLSLLQAYQENGGDREFLLSHKKDIDDVANVILSLLDRDNIAFTKPTDHTKYLMDNCEVYKGLKDLSSLYLDVFQDTQKARVYRSLAERVRLSTLAGFTNGDEFYISVDGKGKNQANWGLWYPDSIAQLYPILYGMISPDSDQAKFIYYKFNHFHKKWMILRPDGTEFPWVNVGYVATLMNDELKVKEFYQQLNGQYLFKGHPYPWYSMESYWMIKMAQLTERRHVYNE